MSSSIWILDYSASHHMSPDSSCFAFMSHSSSIYVMTVDSTHTPLASASFVVTPNLSLSPPLSLSLSLSLSQMLIIF